MATIFISYRRSDTIDKTAQIHTWLVEHFPDERIFLDVDLIPGGTDFRGVIERYVSQSTVMLAIIGSTWLTAADSIGRRRLDDPDDFVRLELTAALERGIPVIPVLVQGSQMPTEPDLPPTLSSLASRQAVQVRYGADFERDMEHLARTIKRYVPRVETLSDVRHVWHRVPLYRLIRANIYDLFKLLGKSFLPLFSLVLVLLYAAVYFHQLDASHDWARSVFHALLLATWHVSLAEFPGDPIGQLLYFLVPLLFFLFVAQLGLSIVRLSVGGSTGISGQAMNWQHALASTYSNHLIICALNAPAFRAVVECIATGYDVVACERSTENDFVSRCFSLGVPVIIGDPRRSDILIRAGMMRARGLIAASNDELVNLEIAQEARSLRPRLRIGLRLPFNDTSDLAPESATGTTDQSVRGIEGAIPLDDELRGAVELFTVGTERKREVDRVRPAPS